MNKPVRIGNAQAFWGDRGNAPAQILLRRPDLDYLTLDYLAEVSMSILAMQRERDPHAGYARDFVDVVRSLAPYWTSGGRCRLITNAGGLNPRGAAEACRAVLEAAGCRTLRIGVVTGDDVLDCLRTAAASSVVEDFCHLEKGTSIRTIGNRLVTANAYLGAAPIVESLADGADIVITGRVADPSLVVAACMHHFSWSEGELDRLAGATVAGHLIECGTQVTGGISTDWLDVPDPAHIGFPFVEVSDDASCIVTKPAGTGGCVIDRTVKEQLVYEIGDPDAYLSPDVTVSFLKLIVEDLGNDRVRVSGATGRPRPGKYKVSATFRDGFRSAGTLTIFGRHAVEKARRSGEVILERVRDAGFQLRETLVECLGTGACSSGILGSVGVREADSYWREHLETVLRVAVEADSVEAAECFSREFMPLITSGPQGTTGYAEGRPRVHPVFRYWPCLIDRERATPHVETIVTRAPLAAGISAWDQRNAMPAPDQLTRTTFASAGLRREGEPTLYDIAYARSGDKGSSANVGVIARNAGAWTLLRTWLTAERVSEYFSDLGVESIERFELPNLRALNFVLHGILRHRLRSDAQGKALGQILLEMTLPENALHMMNLEEHSPEE
jgi:hypothetical protein